MAITYARTGDPTPLALRRQSPVEASEAASSLGEITNGPAKPGIVGDVDAATAPVEPAQSASAPDLSATPRRLSFGMSPARGASPAAPSLSQRTAMRLASPASVELGGGISSSLPIHSVQGFGTRSVRASTRDATAQSIAIQRRNDERLRAKRASDTAKQKLAQSIPEAVPEEEAGDDAPYTTFTGSPASAWGSSVQGTPSVNADDMEATVAALVYESAAESVVSDMTKLTEWMEYSGGAIDEF